MNSFFARSWLHAVPVVLFVSLVGACSSVEASESKYEAQDSRLLAMGHNPLGVAGFVVNAQRRASVADNKRPNSTGHSAHDVERKSWFSESSTTQVESLPSLPSKMEDSIQWSSIRPRRVKSLPTRLLCLLQAKANRQYPANEWAYQREYVA